VQTPLWQLSPTVQALPSLHVPPLKGVWTHPVAGLQVSVVQTLLSSQLIGVKMHPLAGSHVALLQASPLQKLDV
jgi:hypothetical protein